MTLFRVLAVLVPRSLWRQLHHRRITRVGSAASVATASLAALALGAVPSEARTSSAVTVTAPTSTAQPAGPLRVSLRTSGTVRHLRVRFDHRRVKARAAGSQVRRISVPARSFSPGVHYLEASWRDARGRQRTTVHRMLSLRRVSNLLGVRATDPSAAGFVRLRVPTDPGVRDVRVRVHGHTTRLSARGRVTQTMTVKLGAANGIRFGRNRITVTAEDRPDRTYERNQVTVRVAGTQPLLRRTAPYHALAGTSTRLDGRALVPGAASSSSRRLRYRWTIASKPKGSRPVLRGATSARPTVRTDALGRYRLRLRVHRARPRGVAYTGKAEATTSATMTLDVSPPVPVGGAWLDTGAAITFTGVTEAAIQMGEQYFIWAHGQCGSLLLLDASTLAPLNAYTAPGGGDTYAGSVARCASDAELRQSLTDAVTAAQPGGDPLLAVLVTGRTLGDVTIADYDDPASYVFTPDLSAADVGIRSGWVDESGGVQTDGSLHGWLSRDYQVQNKLVTAVGPYAFSPGAFLTYDTHGPGAPGQNTMTIGNELTRAGVSPGRRSVTATIPGGAADGFHLVVLDRGGGTAVNAAYAAGDADALAARINAYADLNGTSDLSKGATVLLQTIGRPKPAGSNWDGLARAVGRLDTAQSSTDFHGGPDALLRLSSAASPAPTQDDPLPGMYALVATVGPDAQTNPLGNAPTSAEATALEGHGELSGLLQATRHDALAPVLSGSTPDATAAALKGLAQGAPPPPRPDDPDEDAVLRFIAGYPGSGFNATGANACYDNVKTVPDRLLVRASYCNANYGPDKWTGWANDLQRWANGADPIPVEYTSGNPRDTGAAEFKAVAATLAAEFRDVASARTQLATGGILPNQVQAVRNQVDSTALHDITQYAPNPSPATPSFNVWRLVAPALTLLSDVPEFEPVAAVADSIELGDAFFESDDKHTSSEGQNTPVSVANLTSEVLHQLDNASLSYAPLLDRLVTDPQKLARLAENTEGLNLGPNFADHNPNNLYAADWVVNDIDVAQAEIKAAQGFNQHLATAWTSGYYRIWQVPTGNPGQRQSRSPSDLWSWNCSWNNNYGRIEWHPFAQNPSAANNDNNDQWPVSTTYVPLDQSTPKALYTLVQRQSGDTPWLKYYDREYSAHKNPDRHVVAANPELLDLLTKPVGSGGYGISDWRLFTRGVDTIMPIGQPDPDDYSACNW